MIYNPDDLKWPDGRPYDATERLAWEAGWEARAANPPAPDPTTRPDGAPKCEGCDSTATTMDREGVDLCAPCAKESVDQGATYFRWGDYGNEAIACDKADATHVYITVAAATAREEAIRAEVIEECARVLDAEVLRLKAQVSAGETERMTEVLWTRALAIEKLAIALRALALARSTGKEA